MEEEEYVLLDLDDVCAQADIPPNAPYVLSGLDTLNPILTIGTTLKLLIVYVPCPLLSVACLVRSQSKPDTVYKQIFAAIGEYQETVGTCYVFSDKDAEKEVMHPETGSSDRNLFKETCIVTSNQAPSKEVQPIAGLHKILKFRIANIDKAATTES